MNRTSALACLVACLALSGCQEPKADAVPLVTGSRDIVVRSARTYQADPGATTSSQAYYIVCVVTFTNDLGYDVAPAAKNFVLQDALGQTYVGVDSGATAFVGVSNYSGIVKKDDKQEYTVGFRVPANTRGSVFYAAY